jgi:hypothetical protein
MMKEKGNAKNAAVTVKPLGCQSVIVSAVRKTP